ncbi:copper transport protein ATOX1 [Nothobranchius furzeri]|uniref:Copper transport protein ATOX1 n=1 Tax=Nothobranchius furzeri TaxID=105023 RepID=A0A9D2YX83_NOTFU|nr:copper transport protein ATOX1 [Nothobranchius furzeri]KAF7228691.1 antioxidant 1 copper chaperone [Nothobranchius furzeri]
MTKHEFKVEMECEKCSATVAKALGKLEDTKFEIDQPNNLVWIESDKDVKVLEDALRKTGKSFTYNGTK